MNRLEFTRFGALDYACTEALNTLCANLSFVGSDIKKIMVTSSQASEGKTFLTMHMMRTLAGLGKRVVFVDADLRRSVIANRYGIRGLSANSRGLAHYLAGISEIEDIVYSIADIQGAYMVPVGREVSNSLSLLSTPRLPKLLEWLAQSADIVLVDAPPIGVIIDGAEIAKSCDGTLLVVSYKDVSRRELNECKKQIERAGCPVLGAVLNNVTFDTISSKKYYYRTYYSQYVSSGNRPVAKANKKPPVAPQRQQKNAK